MALIYCSKCNEAVSDRAAACSRCGNPIAVRGAGIPLVSRVSSGAFAIAPEYVAVRKSRSLAVLLAVVLGGFGIHKFYLERPGQGLLYALFCWTFIPAVVGVLEGCRYMWMDDDRFQRMALKL